MSTCKMVCMAAGRIAHGGEKVVEKGMTALGIPFASRSAASRKDASRRCRAALARGGPASALPTEIDGAEETAEMDPWAYSAPSAASCSEHRPNSSNIAYDP